jgi:gliding motility-associated-like protein
MSDFDNILKQKLENYTDIPSEKVFKNIRKNYPRKTFWEFLNLNKYYFIAAITIIPIAVYFLLPDKTVEEKNTVIIESQNKSNIIYPKENNFSKNNTSIQKYEDTKPAVIPKTEKQNLDIVYVKSNVFNVHDTLICGKEISINYNDKNDYLIIPESIYVTFSNNKLNLKSEKFGNYKIIYQKTDSDIVYRDTLIIRFNEIPEFNVSLSHDKICEGQEINLKIIGKGTQIFTISGDDCSIKQTDNSNYKLYNFHNSGTTQVKITSTNSICKNTIIKEIEVVQKPKLKIASSPNFCSGSNGKLIITTENSTQIKSFVLNNEYESRTGIFSNLNSGIYTLKVNYANNCYLHDTILIKDSLYINPFFIAEKDLLNNKKYFFRNYSKLDDSGYEKKEELQFIWKINGQNVSKEDNFDYEFLNDGKYTVELVAAVKGTKCSSSYSIDILISSNTLKVPNIFTPNGDGIGDEFKVFYDGEIFNYSIIIMNRFGEIVWTNNDINNGWDGKINGINEASEGLYYYIIRGEDKYGVKIEQKGALQLVRN